jgi:hypothetical protein
MKPLEDYPKHKDCYLGRGGQCKKCKYARSVELKVSNPEKYVQKAKLSRVKHKEKRAEYQRQWRKANPELYRASARKLYWDNPEKLRERRRQYSRKNPEVDQINNRKRRALLLSTSTEPYTAMDVIDKYGNTCHLCGKVIDLDAPRWTAIQGWENGLHLDHVLPLSQGGSDTLDNVRPSHGRCNLSKNRILPNSYRSEGEKLESKE